MLYDSSKDLLGPTGYVRKPAEVVFTKDRPDRASILDPSWRRSAVAS